MKGSAQRAVRVTERTLARIKALAEEYETTNEMIVRAAVMQLRDRVREDGIIRIEPVQEKIKVTRGARRMDRGKADEKKKNG